VKAESISFDEWVRQVFDHPVKERAWYWDEEIMEAPPRQFISFGTKLFRNSQTHLNPFSDAQVNAGLHLILSNNASAQIFALKEESIPIEERLGFLDALFDLTRDTFGVRCTPHLSHLDRQHAPNSVSPLNDICYMLWDIFIIYGDREDPKVDLLNRSCLHVVKRSLALKNIAVIEGALHGLGHFCLRYPNEAETAIDHFLESNPRIPSELLSYAKAARAGGVL
jgi:hypothetical protein